jgi:hypothetical protein
VRVQVEHALELGDYNAPMRLGERLRVAWASLRGEKPAIELPPGVTTIPGPLTLRGHVWLVGPKDASAEVRLDAYEHGLGQSKLSSIPGYANGGNVDTERSSFRRDLHIGKQSKDLDLLKIWVECLERETDLEYRDNDEQVKVSGRLLHNLQQAIRKIVGPSATSEVEPPAPHPCPDCERTHPWRECPEYTSEGEHGD